MGIESKPESSAFREIMMHPTAASSTALDATSSTTALDASSTPTVEMYDDNDEESEDAPPMSDVSPTHLWQYWGFETYGECVVELEESGYEGQLVANACQLTPRDKDKDNSLASIFKQIKEAEDAKMEAKPEEPEEGEEDDE